jgi:hypothetical protein
VETQTLERARHENPYHLNTLDILLLREQGILLRLPYISPEELQDRSKSDSLVRVIAIIQIAGMILQILARAVRHLVISQLEIAVIAFASCAIVMYVLNWYKPKGIQVPITILQYSGEAPKEVSDLLSFFSTQVQIPPSPWLEAPERVLGLADSPAGGPIRNHSSSHGKKSENGTGYGLLIGSLLFGGIHLAAWKFDFPTGIEQMLWRITSLYCTSLGPSVSLTAIIDQALSPITSKYITKATGVKISHFVSTMWITLYVLARLYLLVEVFRTLLFLPPDAYIYTWATNVPHIS